MEKYDKNSSFDRIRSRWGKEVIARRADLVEKVKRIKSPSGSLIQEALGFILSYEHYYCW